MPNVLCECGSFEGVVGCAAGRARFLEVVVVGCRRARLEEVVVGVVGVVGFESNNAVWWISCCAVGLCSGMSFVMSPINFLKFLPQTVELGKGLGVTRSMVLPIAKMSTLLPRGKVPRRPFNLCISGARNFLVPLHVPLYTPMCMGGWMCMGVGGWRSCVCMRGVCVCVVCMCMCAVSYLLSTLLRVRSLREQHSRTGRNLSSSPIL